MGSLGDPIVPIGPADGSLDELGEFPLLKALLSLVRRLRMMENSATYNRRNLATAGIDPTMIATLFSTTLIVESG